MLSSKHYFTRTPRHTHPSDSDVAGILLDFCGDDKSAPRRPRIYEYCPRGLIYIFAAVHRRLKGEETTTTTAEFMSSERGSFSHARAARRGDDGARRGITHIHASSLALCLCARAVGPCCQTLLARSPTYAKIFIQHCSKHCNF